jgi:NADH-quinone oxidoreductase subunit J
MSDLLFYVFAAVALGGALGVVTGRSPIASLLFMVTTLASIAGIFVLHNAHFLAAVQVIVYAGAIMVLFLFVIMLLNLGHEYHTDLKGGLWSVLAFVTAGLLAGVLARQLRGAEEGLGAAGALPGAQAIDAALAQDGAVGAIAFPLFQQYVVPFEITGVLLLVAVVGAIVLAKRRVS